MSTRAEDETPKMREAKRIKPSPLILDVFASAEWQGGSQQEVTWASQGDVPTVKVLLRGSVDGRSQSLHWSIPNTGSCGVTVPAGLVPGEYCVRVESTANIATNKVYAQSGIVLVNQGQTLPVISNVAARQLIWHSDSQQEVTWASQGDVPTVKVMLDSADDRKGLRWSIPNTGSCSVTVPTGLVPGEYRVRVESTATDKVCAQSSEAIIVDDEHRERCVWYALGLLGLPHAIALPYQLLRKIAVIAASAPD